MKQLLWFLVMSVLSSGCATTPGPSSSASASARLANPHACIGVTALPAGLADHFEAVQDAALLASSLGAENQGKLCQGQVYRAKSGVTVYRAWNSTHGGSRLGAWWSFERPSGSIADYRARNEICYQWSPLDTLVQCTLKAGTKIVVGTGQSATCSPYLTYPPSETQQVYLENAASALDGCTDLVGEFHWREQ